ncbi:unnamed protein product [Cyclocybe aegerita]|uniref:Uncharacterized protein n=1 Tax=Cyclocybe aegerita TaxID=1973307 RepID=A0A8S0WDB0_CYCAE|nr:unnamed protein product [Cyclocybe aegerita]
MPPLYDNFDKEYSTGTLGPPFASQVLAWSDGYYADDRPGQTWRKDYILENLYTKRDISQQLKQFDDYLQRRTRQVLRMGRDAHGRIYKDLRELYYSFSGKEWPSQIDRDGDWIMKDAWKDPYRDDNERWRQR